MGKRVSSYDEKARRPLVGSWWVWERDNAGARELVQVAEVLWNGEEWFVRLISDGEVKANAAMLSNTKPFRGHMNDLERFWEACLPVGPAQTRSGWPRQDELEAGEKYRA